jgi:hypothetical protein
MPRFYLFLHLPALALAESLAPSIPLLNSSYGLSVIGIAAVNLQSMNKANAQGAQGA